MILTDEITPKSKKSDSAAKASDHIVEMFDRRQRWLWRVDCRQSLVHFGLDSEGSGRCLQNLLTGSPGIFGFDPIKWSPLDDSAIVGTTGGIRCELKKNNDTFEWRFRLAANEINDIPVFELLFDPMVTPTALLPSELDEEGNGINFWLLNAPDFGHLVVESEPAGFWTGINSGERGFSNDRDTQPSRGINPTLRGRALLEAGNVKSYKKGELRIQFRAARPLRAGEEVILRFRPRELTDAGGIDPKIWKRARRAYLNHWQPCGNWDTPERTSVLANNVLSDPASLCLVYYAEPMLFYREPVPGIDVGALLRHSLDYHLDHAVSAQGHVNGFGKMYDLYVWSGANLINAAWVYWRISSDRQWLARHIDRLHLMADYLLRRDVDGDGLIESYGSGNAGTLRDPERADVWFEMVNFGHKNTWTNVVSYRAFLCLAQLLEEFGEAGGAAYYRKHAARLRETFVRAFLSKENGWFVSWISLDGEVHDYGHTFINGLAVAYGLADAPLGRQIMERVVAKSKAIDFKNWHLGVPGNLLPYRKADMMGPALGKDGKPVPHPQFSWPESMDERQAFGFRYTNGTIHPSLTSMYLLGLQVAGLDDEADRILGAMLKTAERGGFQNGVVNVGGCGAEHFFFDGSTCGYEGYLPECWNFLMALFTRDPSNRRKVLPPEPGDSTFKNGCA